MTVGGLSYFLPKILEKRFVRKMTMEDGNILHKVQSYENLMPEEQSAALYLLKEYEKAHPKIALLRPSQPTQDDDTLLRAVAYTETTPQDQLLHPTNPNDPNTQ